MVIKLFISRAVGCLLMAWRGRPGDVARACPEGVAWATLYIDIVVFIRGTGHGPSSWGLGMGPPGSLGMGPLREWLAHRQG